MNNRLVELQKKLRDALLSGQYTKVAKLQKQIQIEKSRKELVPLNTLLPEMTPEQTEEALMKMHKVFVMADMLYGFALDFESTIQKYDPSMTLLVTNKVRQIKQVSSEISIYRNNPITPAIEPLMVVLKNENRGEELRVAAAETLGWYHLHYDKARIIKELKAYKTSNEKVMNEIRKTINRLEGKNR